MSQAEVFNDRSAETNISQKHFGLEVVEVDARTHLASSAQRIAEAYQSYTLPTYANGQRPGFISQLTKKEIWVYDGVDFGDESLVVGIHIKASPQNPNSQEDTELRIFADPETEEITQITATCKLKDRTTGKLSEAEEYLLKTNEDIGPQPPDQVIRGLNFLNQELFKAGIH